MAVRGPLNDLIVPLVAVATLPVGILATMFLSVEAGVVVFVVGWFLLLPVLAILGGETTFGWRHGTDGSVEEDPIEHLRERYAAGEIDEVEFERRLDALLETEGLDAGDEAAIERAVERIGTGSSSSAGRSTQREPE